MDGSLIAPFNEAEVEMTEIKDEPVGDADVEQLKMVPDPGQPTEAEVEEHRTNGHIPYRSWCKWCAMGRGIGFPHNDSKTKASIPRIGIDYFYIT